MKHLIEFCCLMKKEKVFRYFNKESVFGWKSHFYTHPLLPKKEKKDFILMEKRKYFILIKINKKGYFCECLEFKVVCIS